MKIGVIGAGFIGRAVTALATKAGHEVMISNSRYPSSLMSSAEALGVLTGTSAEAAAFGDVVVIAVPFSSILQLPVEAMRGKVVVDASNYHPERDGRISALDARETTTSEMVESSLREARVVKAFNAIRYDELEKDARPAGAADRRAMPVAGDDLESKRLVCRLVEEIGFDPHDAGSLSESWRFERAKPANRAWHNLRSLPTALEAAQRDIDVHEAARDKSRMPAPYSLERLADRAQIADLMARYCRSVDRLDFDAMRASYHADATDNHGAYVGNVDGFVDYVRQRHADIPFSMHAVSNMLIEFVGVDHAVAETYVTTFQTYPPQASASLAVLGGKAVGENKTSHFYLAGRYVDEITRRNGEWRFAKRTGVYEAGVLLEGEATAKGKDWITGRRDKTDEIYRTLAAATASRTN